MQRIGTIATDETAPKYHRFRSQNGEQLLIVPYTRIFSLSTELARIFDRDAEDREVLVNTLSEPITGEDSLDDVVAPQPQSISLNISSSCNLACSYCYAARGNFAGAQPKPMNWATARAAIDTLLSSADPTAPVTIGFLGGEPFLNRELLRACVEYTRDQGGRRNLDVRFSVTTNGTLLRSEDLALLRAHRFAVTVSIDGGATVHDLQRPAAGAKATGSFASLKRCIAPLLNDPGQAQIAARATVTRQDLDLPRRFHDILEIGFPEVGFAPLRVDRSQDGNSLREQDWPTYFEALKCVAIGEIARARTGEAIRLTNLAVALKQIARGASSPYPCGAGGGYFSVAADGKWYACHRAIGTASFEMGDTSQLNEDRRRAFLRSRHVHAIEPCRTCWARYLCSGACHQEAPTRNDAACDFIRAWLEFCCSVYCDLSARPNTAPDEREVVSQ